MHACHGLFETTYGADAAYAIGVDPGVEVRVKGVNGIGFAADYERHIDLGIARYNPYVAYTTHGL